MTKHILTIDDETEIREVLCAVLTRAGYRVTAVSSAVEAMQIVLTDQPHLIITDLQLEETDGFDVIDQVKLIAPEVPIILLTGMLFDPDVIRGTVGEKIACYVEKTAPLEHILQQVKLHLPK